MFVNKINSVSNLGFKGYEHVKNDVGETVMRFNYPYDSETETCELQFFRVAPTDRYNYKINETPIAKINLKPEGVDVNLQEITNLDKDETFAYKVIRRNKETGNVIYEGPDTGVKVKPENGEYVFRVKQWEDNKLYQYTLVTRKGTTPRSYGAGYLITPDSFMPGAMYRGFKDDNTGEIYYDEQVQKNVENVPKNFSNVFGGSLAGIQKMIPYLKETGYGRIFLTPIANGSGPWCLGYWNKNNMQVSPNMGNTENFNSFFRDMYKAGITGVFDGTFTSEGLEGIHHQYALRWAEKNPQTYYWFRMSNMKNSSLGMGVLPKNPQDAGFRIVNAPKLYELQSDGTYKKVPNPDYKENQETYCQIFDKRQASERQIKDYDNAIVNYENLRAGNEIDINTHDDTLINYTFLMNDANIKELDKNIDIINDLNKKQGKSIKLDTPEGLMMACDFSNYKFIKKTEGGEVMWDANTDMVKMNYHISGYDEKILQAIPDKNKRDYERNMIIRGTCEVRDMAIQAGRYWTKNVKDVQTIYTAQTVGNVKTAEALNKLVDEGKLPKEAKINDTVMSNILNGEYLLEPKGVLDKDSVTVKSLMELPLDTLEFGENTTGVLSTSYFSNRATTEDTIGKTRFELMKDENPHLVEPYTKVYNKVDDIFNHQLKDFADSVISRVNETSNEKLLDSSGNYTEYGEYVMELVGKDIAKYALLKSLSGESFKTKTLNNGEITYDYDALKKATTLKALGIKAHNPQEEAEILEKKIEKGLNTLSDSDIAFVAEAIGKRISGTDTTSFRLAEALVDRAAKGLDWRLDAAKDVMDMDAVRNEDECFDDSWNELIKFWAQFVQTVKEQNPSSYIVAEMTDVGDLMRDTYGLNSCPYEGKTNIGQMLNGEPDAMAKFFNETGITTEAAYSYFFTDLLIAIGPNFENGKLNEYHPHDAFKEKIDLLLKTRSADYLRNLYTFIGNHDKPRMIHGLSVDMALFHSKLLHNYKDFDDQHDQRLKVIQTLSGAKTQKDVPIELRLNVDNNDYFRTLSSKAIAQSELLMGCVYEDLDGIASAEDKQRIVEALVDLANGNYLGVGSTEAMTKINIAELSSLENAFEAILKMAENHGLKLTEAERKELVKKVVDTANNKDLNNYLVRGGFDWDIDLKELHKSQALDVLGRVSDFNNYSLYTIKLAKLLKDSYVDSKMNPEAMSAISAGIKDFAEKYNRQTVEANTGEFKKIEDFTTAMRKNGYGARDIKLAIRMAIKQAEYKTKTPIENKEAIIDAVSKSATEVGIQKAAMLMEFLKGLFGVNTMYAGDEFGMTGYEEKAKNIYFQNRNVLPWSEREKLKAVMDFMNRTAQDRSNPETHALNDGTPYPMDVLVNNLTRNGVYDKINKINAMIAKNPENKKELEEERNNLSKELAKIAYMMQSSNGDMTVSLFNADGIDHANRVDYFAKYKLDTEEKRKKFFEENNIESINPNNKYVPIQPKSELDAIMLAAEIALPLGTIFRNANPKDTTEYVVKKLEKGLGIVKKDGGKIVMDGKTARNGVMVLKHIAFKGSKHREYFNPQYNFVSNPYKIAEPVEEGQNLSIISR